MSKKPMLVGNHTYGYYYPDGGYFRCTHGAWESECSLIDDEHCKLKSLNDKQLTYKFLDSIPSEYNYT